MVAEVLDRVLAPAAAACGCASAYAAHMRAAASRSGGKTGAVASGMDPMLPRGRCLPAARLA
ncbi:hypothetical protein BC477_06125 [Clavibacter michiganensis subsp. michiganensis]|uniref:Uncharacterized protein n=1 Tax=Clavibacter michiganensis subsp. michiganensis TaxID=33013 RepID=A0A251XM55_CLAMM|nr:hypothetical protein BC477_06125 [Clavibacter michiganensis subsp. michiganensis]OUE04293.1 hypothetical protein CMMCAS07_05055 [Clavibacter michiganensis subsp. michiganensis]